MTQLALKQATIDYREYGPQDSAHPPVFFVHGVLVDGELWYDVAEKLGRLGYRCIVPTLPLGSHTIPVTDPAALSLRRRDRQRGDRGTGSVRGDAGRQ
jgi:pimeloyl-ACP methyl ester carboxylesterase